tara:strand:- start:5026 stop:5886 length:861 start_codon:yes stop_codon:yes gene_type:complete
MSFKIIIEKNIDDTIKKYTEVLANKFNLEKSELYQIWIDVKIENNTTQSSIEEEKSTVKKMPEKKIVLSKDTQIKTSLTCPYVFTKGSRCGEQCGCKPKNGNKYCCKHKKYEDIPIKEKKITPTVKKEKVNIILRKHKLTNMLWHSESGMVFKSCNERTVIGRIINDKLNPLSESDIEECKRLNFKYSIDNLSSSEDQVKEDQVKEDQVREMVSKALSLEEETNISKKKISSVFNTTNSIGQNIEDILSGLQEDNYSNIDELDFKGDLQSEKSSIDDDEEELLEED